jgi:amino acid transporter
VSDAAVSSREERLASRDDDDVRALGYAPKLHRVMGGYTSFSLGFAVVSITTGIFTAFSTGLVNLGGVSIWIWLPVIPSITLIALVFAHVSARIPLSGYAYQWSSRLGNVHLGWFTGWAAFLTFTAGTAAVATTFATVFAPEFWSHPTYRDVQMLTAAVVLVCFVLNLVGIKVATMVNNLAATAELVGTIGIGLVVLVGVFFFFHHQQGPSVLFNAHPADGSPVSFDGVVLAALLPILLLTGWEGCADLAEETRDPRRTAPKMMLRALLISAVAGFLLVMVFEVAIPHSVGTAVGGSESPIIYILNTQIGAGMGTAMKVVAFVAILSCCLANMAVATRLVFSLSRDRLLPGHAVLSKVNDRTGTPIASIVLITVLALVFTLFSAGIVARIFSIVIVAYYLIYLLTLVSVLMGDRAGRIPAAPGYFTLGRSLRPIAWVGIVYTGVAILALTVPKVNHISAEYTLGGMAIGLVWWLGYLRPRLAANEVGPGVASSSPTARVPATGRFSPTTADQETS